MFLINGQMIRSTLVLLLVVLLVFPPHIVQARGISSLNLPVLGSLVNVSDVFVPLMLKGISIDKKKPLQFDFIVDSGNDEIKSEEWMKKEAEQLIKYFLAGLTIPEEDLWVNLSPYEKEGIIPEGFGKTEMGRDLLAQDYLLKQLSASLMYPEGSVGKAFWKRLYQSYFKKEGLEGIAINILNKVWIVPDEAVVFEKGVSGYVVKSTLKVLMEEDYLAVKLEKEEGKNAREEIKMAQRIMREEIIPEIEREVNEGKHFTKLRQIYHALILAKWYKQKVNNVIMENLYEGKNKLSGIKAKDEDIAKKIYKEYVRSYKQGVFDYVKEEYIVEKQEIVAQRYFSGGAEFGDFSVLTTRNKDRIEKKIGVLFKVGVKFNPLGKGKDRDSEEKDLAGLTKSDGVANNFIVNGNDAKSLKDRLGELISVSTELKFLVGFFYFSGVRELYEKLKENSDTSIKILVGLSLDEMNKSIVETSQSDKVLSDGEHITQFLKSIKYSLNTSEFDTKEFYEQIMFFVDLLKKDRLTIRKTANPNHSKLYIFKLDEKQIGKSKLFITGSSNLTKAGIITQEEFNVEISDYGFDIAEAYFDTLWENSVEITENPVYKEKLLDTIKKNTLVNEVSPFEAFFLVLRTYLDSFDQKNINEELKTLMKDNGYEPYQYQLDAVKQALAIIENHNGVIIADVVGLGKSVIASLIGKSFKKRGIIISPPGIIGDDNKTFGWKKYVEDFKLHDWEVRSLGKLEEIEEFVKKTEDVEVVIIDEAHRFRKEDTQGYEYLRNICRNKIVILLTATPFNNDPGDLLSLLKLFIIPKKSTITLDDNLNDQFNNFKNLFKGLIYIQKYKNSSKDPYKTNVKNYYKTIFGSTNIQMEEVRKRLFYLSKEIRDILEPVMIRRNRLDLKNNQKYKKEIKHLSRVNDPKQWYFDLSAEQSQFYDKVIGYFGESEEGRRFKGTIYQPLIYRKESLNQDEKFQQARQKNLYDFMRRLLVKRFESSFGSFKKSIENFRDVNESALKFIKRTDKFVFDRKILEKVDEYNSEEIEKYLKDISNKLSNIDFQLQKNQIYNVGKDLHKEDFIKDIESDLKMFDEILRTLSELKLIDNDPKSFRLLEGLEKILLESKDKENKEPKRKIIIFSEYQNTVDYLSLLLKKENMGRVLVVGKSLTPSLVQSINENFDASYNESKQKDEYDILLTSDKVSEGFNLNRAGVVINYDIPWNPVRVIQRLGRINRINKKVFETLDIVNFFPTDKGSNIVQSRSIAEQKMFLIHNTLGEDVKIFGIDEKPTASNLFNNIQRNPDSLEEESFYTRLVKKMNEIKDKYPALWEKFDQFPLRVKVAKYFGENEVLVFIKKKRMYIRRLIYDLNNGKRNEVEDALLEDILDHIKVEEGTKRLPLSDQFWERYAKVKNREEIVPSSHKENRKNTSSLSILSELSSEESNVAEPYKSFLKTLIEDIESYGTLPEYTLNKIKKWGGMIGKVKVIEEEIKALKKRLGSDYLSKEKKRTKNFSKEIIIAIENQSLKKQQEKGLSYDDAVLNEDQKRLQKLINGLSLDTISTFFRNKSYDFVINAEEFDQFNEGKFANAMRHATLKFEEEGRKMIVFSFEVTEDLTQKSSKKDQYDKGKDVLKSLQANAGIFIFYDSDHKNFRFSLIYANYSSGKIDWNNFRRFTYFVSKDSTNKTFLQRIGNANFSSLKDIKEAFSVETLTKQFYNDVNTWYSWALEEAKFPEYVEKQKNGREESIIRLITRLTFIWFMRERGLIPKKLFEKKFISDILKSNLSDNSTDYYRAILQNLFFAVLNTTQKDRKYKISKFEDQNTFHYQDMFKDGADQGKKHFQEIPFLNGGLFESLDRKKEDGMIYIDGFTDKEDQQVKIPNKIFFSEEHNIGIKEEDSDKVIMKNIKGLIDIFSSYNFTIDESDSNDDEIALDPELLGHIFENLLASYNPETKETARKSTGSYYTPRKIVDYMVIESLKEYFRSHLNSVEDLEEKMKQLFSKDDEINLFTKEFKEEIIGLIDKVRILDLSVGSGAFPMGILNQLVFILEKVDPENKIMERKTN